MTSSNSPKRFDEVLNSVNLEVAFLAVAQYVSAHAAKYYVSDNFALCCERPLRHVRFINFLKIDTSHLSNLSAGDVTCFFSDVNLLKSILNL